MRPASRPRPSDTSIIEVGESLPRDASHAACAIRGVKERCRPDASELPNLPVTNTTSPGRAVERRIGPRIGWGTPMSVVVSTSGDSEGDGA